MNLRSLALLVSLFGASAAFAGYLGMKIWRASHPAAGATRNSACFIRLAPAFRRRLARFVEAASICGSADAGPRNHGTADPAVRFRK